MNKKTLVMGVGNPILKDDGVGIHAVRELKKTLTGVDYLEESLSGLELIEQFRGYDRIVIIDAVKTQGGVPGEMYPPCPGMPCMRLGWAAAEAAIPSASVNASSLMAYFFCAAGTGCAFVPPCGPWGAGVPAAGEAVSG